MAPLVVDLLRPRSVVDVGCGTGLWLAEFKRLGVGDVQGVDLGGQADSDLILSPDEFVRHDLSQPLALGRRFDLAVCLEVAEHLPASAADRIISEVTALAPAVLFSAAIPHQGGVGHVNEQWPEYWAEKFGQHGYRAVDAIRPLIWSDRRVDFWYAQNVLLFVTLDVLESNERLRAAAERTTPLALSRVHPRLYLAKADRRDPLRIPLERGIAAARRRAGGMRKSLRHQGPRPHRS